jgi:hypothetical protein
MSYIILRGRWCHIIVLNVHAPTEDKTDDVKDSFYEELERVFDKFPKYHMKILFAGLEDLDTEVEINSAWETIRENITISVKEILGYFELKKHKP